MEDEIKVSELPIASQVNDADLLMIIQGEANKKLASQILKEYVINAIPKQKPEYIVVRMTANSTMNAAGIIPFNTVAENTSERLSLTSNQIVIGSGIKRVEISGSVFAEDLNTSPLYLWTDLRKNGTEIQTSIADTSTNYGTTTFATLPLQVNAGDKIDLYKLNNSSQTIRGTSSTFLMVKVIEEA